MIVRLTALFPLWAVLFSIWAYAQPDTWASLKPAIVPLLSVVMFGMGLGLTVEDFARVLKTPKTVALGVGLQFLLMPLIGWILVQILGLSGLLAVGIILVGSCPGGTASNVICYLARGDVALSITLTAVSTLLAVFATPLLSWIYIGREVPVPVAAMMMSVLKIIIVPVVLGGTVNHFCGERLTRIKAVFPLLSVAAIVIIIAIIVGANAAMLAGLALPLVAAVVLHNLLGLGAGYGLTALMGYDRRTRRTLAIEVGMQNSGLAVVLVTQHFGAAAALPGALFSVWHNLSGAFLASRWARAANVQNARSHEGKFGGKKEANNAP
jgi:BASS family bile acid:Na+ symporter